MKYLSLTIPGAGGESIKIETPPGIPSGEHFTLGLLATAFLEVAMIVGISRRESSFGTGISN